MAAARVVAEDVLAPAAEVTDRSTRVSASHLRALAGAGLLDLRHASPGTVREVFEVLSGACGATFFTSVQHHAPVRLLAASPNTALRDRLLPGLCSGELIGGVAFAHLRRPGPPAVAARPVPGGFRLDGEAPWLTGWGIAQVAAVAACVPASGSEPSRVIFAAVPMVETAHVVPSPPLALSAMGATSTVRVAFDGLAVAEADVICELELDEWRASDLVATAQPNPAPLGLAGTCTRLLAAGDPDLAGALEAERLALRSASYGLADEGRTDREHLARQVGLRADALVLAVRAANALVAATGGLAMELAHPAQRLAREASFYLVQAQTPTLRQALAERLVWAGR